MQAQGQPDLYQRGLPQRLVEGAGFREGGGVVDAAGAANCVIAPRSRKVRWCISRNSAVPARGPSAGADNYVTGTAGEQDPPYRTLLASEAFMGVARALGYEEW